MSDVSAHETGMIRVYEIGLPPDEAARLAEGDADGMAEVLGVDRLDPAGVEVIDATALAGVGVDGYLVEGLGADEAALAADGARLRALSGPVAIVRSQAFGGRAVTLSPSSVLRPVGIYPELAATPVTPRFPTDGEAGAPLAHGQAGPADDPTPVGGLPKWVPIVALVAVALIVLVVLL